MKHIYSSSEYGTLVFLDRRMLDQFEKETRDVFFRAYGRIREVYGIWAGNQDRFVQHESQLNEWDGDYTEAAYQRWLEEQN
jgi:hypothetical protein